MSAVGTSEEPVSATPRKRRLKPEIAARIAAQRVEARLEQLYNRQVEELSPEELKLMKAYFLRG